MTDEAFLQTIAEDLDDDTPRLVYADWLDEHGQPERAEFIRVQCELAGMTADDPRRDDLRTCEQELLAEHGDAWGMRPYGPFERGFQERALVYRYRCREILNREDLDAVTSADRGMLFVDAVWSGPSRQSMLTMINFVRAWVRAEDAFAISFHWLDIDREELVARLWSWLVSHSLWAQALGPLMGGSGAVVWVRHGALADAVVCAAPEGVVGLINRTRRVFQLLLQSGSEGP
jgi:uncharacterized protein (TIGR02996 family)